LVDGQRMTREEFEARYADRRVVATLDDYKAVYELVIDLFNEGVEASVSPSVREAVRAVAAMCAQGEDTVSVSELAKRLNLDKSATSRRVRVACELGYLINLEERRGKPARLTIGEPMPDEEEVLPRPETLAEENIPVIPPCNTATLQHPALAVDLSPAERYYLNLASQE